MSWPESRCSSGAQARALAVRTGRRAEDGAREGDGRGIIFVRLAQGGSVASMSCLGTLGACRPAAGPGDSEARLTRRGDHHECVEPALRPCFSHPPRHRLLQTALHHCGPLIECCIGIAA